MKMKNYRYRKWFQWLFADKWEALEKELRDNEWEQYCRYRSELEQEKKAINSFMGLKIKESILIPEGEVWITTKTENKRIL